MNLLSVMVAILAASNITSPAEKAMSNQGNTPPKSSFYFGEKKGSLLEIIDGGNIIVLDDNSKWLVNPDDTVYTGGWLGPAPVIVRKDGPPSEEFNYSMTNMWTKKTVQVRTWKKKFKKQISSPTQNVQQPAPSKSHPTTMKSSTS